MASNDRATLLAMLAYRNGFIDQERLVATLDLQSADPRGEVAEVLASRGGLGAETISLLEGLTDHQVQVHGGASQGLEALTTNGAAIEFLLTRRPETAIPPSLPPLDGTTTPTDCRYRSLEFHAKGGLGKVFIAIDEELKRKVALKEIQDDKADNPALRSRFVAEAEITGQLEHPGIVPVYGLGTYADGRPFYAMRFIKGESLKAAIRRYHAEPDPDASRRAVQLRGLLRRFLDVCNAIDYAHARGVLHRDLKPDNVMLGQYGETLVVDWGLARVMDAPQTDASTQFHDEESVYPSGSRDGFATVQGRMMGTVGFMSPEQAAGRHDELGPASDVYSLGAILYYLLTGRAPITGGGADDEILSKLQQGRFPSPRQLVPGTPRSLDAICLKALAISPGDRYPSAPALATDLERWLADEPVSVYEEPWHVKLARWGRRHRTAVASVFALLSTALVATLVGYVLVNRGKARIEQNYQLARSAVEQMLTEVGDVELADVPQMEGVRRKLLDRAKAFYDKFLEERKDDPKLKTDTGRAHARLGDIEEMLGQYGDAEPSYKEAITLLEQPAAVGAAAELDRKRALARTLGRLGILYRKSNRFVDSEASFRKALELRKELAARPDATPDDQRGLADVRYQLGALLARQGGREGEDEQLYQEAINAQTQLASKDAGNLALRAERARSLNNLGILQKTSGKFKEAEATWNEALKIMEGLSQAEAGVAGHRWQFGRILTNLALIKVSTNRSAEAEADFKRGLGYLQPLVGEYPRVPEYARDASVILNNLGLLVERGIPARPESAEKDFKEAQAFQEQLAKTYPTVPDHRQKLALTELHLAGLYEPTKPTEAEALYRQAIDRMAKMTTEYPSVPEYKSSLGLTYYSLGVMLGKSMEPGKTREAMDLLRKAAENHAAAAKASPRNFREPDNLRLDLQVLCILLVQQGQTDDLLKTVKQLADVRPEDPDGYVLAASFLARAAGGASLNLKTAETLGAQAVELLGTGAKKGPIRAGALDEAIWKPIEARPDFQAIRDENDRLRARRGRTPRN